MQNNTGAFGVGIVFSGLFLILSLAGCGIVPTRVQTINTPINIPAEKFQCEQAEPRPTGAVIMESQVAKYINSLEFAKKDCDVRLKELQIIVQCYNDPKCNVDSLLKYIGVVDASKPR
jgi:hypothetical protein